MIRPVADTVKINSCTDLSQIVLNSSPRLTYYRDCKTKLLARHITNTVNLTPGPTYHKYCKTQLLDRHITDNINLNSWTDLLQRLQNLFYNSWTDIFQILQNSTPTPLYNRYCTCKTQLLDRPNTDTVKLSYWTDLTQIL